MYKPDSLREVAQDSVFHWTMQGPEGRNANLEFALQIHFVSLPDGTKGFILGIDTILPDEIEVHGLAGSDSVSYKGRVLWLKDHNGLAVTFEDEIYPLVVVEKVNESGGKLYFHSYLPKEFGDGQIVLDESQWLESAPSQE